MLGSEADIEAACATLVRRGMRVRLSPPPRLRRWVARRGPPVELAVAIVPVSGGDVPWTLAILGAGLGELGPLGEVAPGSRCFVAPATSPTGSSKLASRRGSTRGSLRIGGHRRHGRDGCARRAAGAAQHGDLVAFVGAARARLVLGQRTTLEALARMGALQPDVMHAMREGRVDVDALRRFSKRLAKDDREQPVAPSAMHQSRAYWSTRRPSPR